MLDVISKLEEKPDGELNIECRYEAGCLGFSLYNEPKATGVKCVVMAPPAMLSPQRKRIKTDARDAEMIAQCLAHTSLFMYPAKGARREEIHSHAGRPQA